MASKDIFVLERSDDPQLLLQTAVEFARGASQNDHTLLLSHLEKESFLSRLDTPEDYLAPPRQLRLARILKTLMSNPAPPSKQILVSLTTAADFVSFEPRQELLIRALVVVRPAPPQSARFWSEHSQPESPYLHVTISALADNGTPNALALMEERMADQRFEQGDKISWMRDPVLLHRNEIPMLQTCERMLGATLPAELRPALVEALFDYKPEWYLSCQPPHPPARQLMIREARDVLRSIGRRALDSIPLDAPLKTSVELVLREIGS